MTRKFVVRSISQSIIMVVPGRLSGYVSGCAWNIYPVNSVIQARSSFGKSLAASSAVPTPPVGLGLESWLLGHGSPDGKGILHQLGSPVGKGRYL